MFRHTFCRNARKRHSRRLPIFEKGGEIMGGRGTFAKGNNVPYVYKTVGEIEGALVSEGRSVAKGLVAWYLARKAARLRAEFCRKAGRKTAGRERMLPSFLRQEGQRPCRRIFALSNFDNVAFCACRQPLSPPSYVEQNAVTALLLQYHRHTFFQKSIDFLTGEGV